MTYFMKVSIICSKLVCGFRNQGYIFVSLKRKRKNSTFTCCFLVTLLNPTCSWFRPRPLAYFLLSLFKTMACYPKSGLCVGKLRSFFLSVTVVILKTSRFSHKLHWVLFYMPEFYHAERLQEKGLGCWTFWQTEKRLLFAGGRMDKGVFEWHRGDERAWTASDLSDPGGPAGI